MLLRTTLNQRLIIGAGGTTRGESLKKVANSRRSIGERQTRLVSKRW
jgi:hypothetical protein